MVHVDVVDRAIGVTCRVEGLGFRCMKFTECGRIVSSIVQTCSDSYMDVLRWLWQS